MIRDQCNDAAVACRVSLVFLHQQRLTVPHARCSATRSISVEAWRLTTTWMRGSTTRSDQAICLHHSQHDQKPTPEEFVVVLLSHLISSYNAQSGSELGCQIISTLDTSHCGPVQCDTWSLSSIILGSTGIDYLTLIIMC